MLGALATRPATAQNLLDLDKPAPAEVGEKAAAVTLAETLEAQADVFDVRPEESSAIRGDLRRLAAALLRAGQDAGDRGGPRLVAARTIVNHLDELDALAAGAWEDGVGRLLVLGDLRRARERIPPDDEGLDRLLRDALWRLAERAEPAPTALGWVGTPAGAGAPEARAARDLLRTLGASAESLDGVDRLLALADEAATRRAFAPAAARVRSLLDGACEPLRDPPRWVGTEQLAAGAQGVALGGAALLDPQGRTDARDRLARYAALGAIIRRADALDRGNDAKALRERLGASLADPPSASTLDALTRALDLLDAIDAETRDERSLVRQLRPAWRWSERAGVLAGRTLAARLAPIADTPDPLTNPGVLSDLAAARAPLELLDALVALSDRLDQDPDGPADRPEVAPEFEALAGRLLKAAADLDDPQDGAGAREMIVRIASDLARAEAIVSVEDARLAPVAAGVRAQVIDAWTSEDGDPEAARAALGRAEDVARWIEDAALVEQVAGGGSLVQSWAAFELSPEAARVLRGDVDTWVERVLANLAKGDIGVAEGMLGRLDREHAGTAAVGALERRLRALTGLERADASWSVVAEIGFGPPDVGGAWLIDQRGRVATLCAQAEELAAATIRDDRPAAGDLRAALNATAEALVRAVEGR